MGRGEEADYFETQIPSPQPSPRLGGAREENGLGFAFPTPQQIARVTEAELRECKMGFRAPHLLAAARQIAGGQFDLERLRHLPQVEAREELMKLRGVGCKIADCVLLFAFGFDGAFPVDVWVKRALRELYFPRRRVSAKRLQHFAATHFRPHAGYAQQYLFHYTRTKLK
jgi:N-glycosylase/DNA lyase